MDSDQEFAFNETAQDDAPLWSIARYDAKLLRVAAIQHHAMLLAQGAGLTPTAMINSLFVDGIKLSEVNEALRLLFEDHMIELSGKFTIQATRSRSRQKSRRTHRHRAPPAG
jgi:hypothetical protein